MLGVVYDTLMWSWNLNSEKVKCILHILYDMLGLGLLSVTNELAMKVSGINIHYSPLLAEEYVLVNEAVLGST